MTSKTSSSSVKSDDFHRLVEVSGTKWLCFTRAHKDDGELVLGVSDGVDIWQRIVGRGGMSAELTQLRTALLDGEVTVSRTGDKMNISLTVTGGRTTDYDLCKTADGQTEMKSLLFSLAERSADLTVRLAQSEQTAESLKRRLAANTAAHSNIFDMTANAKKKKTQAKSAPKQAGMSVINPGSRKRSKAKGVQFD